MNQDPFIAALREDVKQYRNEVREDFTKVNGRLLGIEREMGELNTRQAIINTHLDGGEHLKEVDARIRSLENHRMKLIGGLVVLTSLITSSLVAALFRVLLI